MTPVDLRSDTLTLPTPAMRKAMAEAEVGDDVFGEDPTVRLLEEETAAALGKPGAVFVPSGTMSNQLAIRSHCQSGDEMLVEAQAHIYYYEGGAPAALSGVMPRCLAGTRGVFTKEEVLGALRPPDPHFAPTRLVCLENTHNRGGGSIWPLEGLAAVCALAREKGLATHLDGARIWNATAATGVGEAVWASHFDSVSVCFSKGLGAPIGSALVGDLAFLQRARRFRKQFGGGMRQAGILAAGALHGLRHHRTRLVEDHENARRLAEGLAELRGVSLDLSTVRTNMVLFGVVGRAASDVVLAGKGAGVLVLATGPSSIRAVTHLGVDRAAIDRALELFRRILD